LSSVLPTFILLLLLAILRQLLRTTWAAVLVTTALGVVLLGEFSSLAGWVVSFAFVGLVVGLLIRLGLLAAAVALTVDHLLAHVFLTTHLTAWSADSAVAGFLATAALAAWGFCAATRHPGRGRVTPPA